MATQRTTPAFATATPTPQAGLASAVAAFLAAHDAVIKAGSGGLFYHHDFDAYDDLCAEQQRAIARLRAALAKSRGEAN